MRYTLATIALTAALLPGVAAAQTGAATSPAEPKQVISTNPFGLMLTWVNGDYERKVSSAATAGVSASYFADGEFGAAAGVARWYPQGAALEGFYLGARVGAFAFTTREYEYQPAPVTPANRNDPSVPKYPIYHEHTRVEPGAGIEMGYNWLLGRKDNISVGLGFGITRLARGGNDYVPNVLPNIRLVNIGVAF